MADVISSIDASIAALRERGAARVDPVRLRFIESLARRSAGYEGAVRHRLDARLAALVAACSEALDQAAGKAVPVDAAPRLPPLRGPLADLVAQLGRPVPLAPKAQVRPAPAELETLPFFRRTWSRLSADQRLAQSQAALPENAGPLNSHHLVHRALTLMRDLSPGYFDRFVAHADALLSLQNGKG